MDPNECTVDGFTALLVAVQEGHVKVIALLLADPRVDVNQPAYNGYTPLFLASFCGHAHAVSRKHLRQQHPSQARTFGHWFSSWPQQA